MTGAGNARKLVGYEMRTQVEVSDVALDQVGSLLSQGSGGRSQ